MSKATAARLLPSKATRSATFVAPGEGRSALGLAAQPTLDVLDCVGDHDFRHVLAPWLMTLSDGGHWNDRDGALTTSSGRIWPS